MDAKQRTKKSKFLSFILRHNPGAIGLILDAEGWADIDELIAKAAADGRSLTLDQIKEVVATDNKQRYSLSADEKRIRANQGHSINVDLGFKPLAPPAILYHGTATRFLDSIKAKGLISGRRQHVHLSTDTETAVKVGQRHGKPVVLIVDAAKMAEAGHLFYCSENGVWLTEHVPVGFLRESKE
ncbi:MAG: RNA 2'-phosphotransferase [Chloroflexota bacterium]